MTVETQNSQLQTTVTTIQISFLVQLLILWNIKMKYNDRHFVIIT